ncbi:ty3-gypsy retrotransposon protein [Tanacetum coccineum]|uniref:Ty3-gypsy retrotransposon protein n=1 Tax=Tanacetum coccineum TaxID=301880 RepID=A0ABQ5B2A7_9ASTR
MVAPLTNLLSKEGFKWGKPEMIGFEALKLQLSTTPVLSLPDFEQTFVVETDAADEGIGATKYSTQAIWGYLQPLAMPTTVWEDVSMDFVTGMALSKGFTVVLVVVDRFSKYAHLAPLPASFNANKVAEVFVDTIIKLHGIPKSIVFDHLLDTAYRTYWVPRIEILRYGVLGSLGTMYWLFGYGELAENVLLMVFDQSIIYGVSADVDTAYSSKSGNGLEFFKVITYGVCF